jgi:plastocyanin
VTSRPLLGLAAALCLLAGGCGASSSQPSGAPLTLGENSPTQTDTQGQEPTSTRKVDPRRDGFEIGFGEFAVTLEAPAIRPGPVTFEVRNGGKLVHGFEMEVENPNEDNSGPGGGGDEGFKIEKPTFEPGQTLRFRLNLAPGIYKIECYVASHSDIGMEILLDVRPGAPLVRQEVAGAGGDAVAIEGFAFDPQSIEVPAGTEITWTNNDPTDHTVTAEDDSFDSGPIASGDTFSTTIDGSGAVTYFCAIHPTMKGAVQFSG